MLNFYLTFEWIMKKIVIGLLTAMADKLALQLSLSPN